MSLSKKLLTLGLIIASFFVSNEQYGEYEGSGETNTCRPMPYAVVANTGDCRLLTDYGTGSHEYHQVTTDHRPDDPGERSRLVKCVRQGNAILGREVAKTGVLRVYPGGLAVSRSLGDLECSGAVICTPDIFKVPIAGKQRTHRFVLGCDGLWDVMSNAEVGKIVARVQTKDVAAGTEKEDADDKEDTEKENEEGTSTDDYLVVTPNQAAARLMKQCLKKGGHLDDVTILIVDVTYTGNKSGNNTLKT